jgi:prevent-host-death family protein
MTTAVGLRELRQSASDLVRRVEDGEEILITVSGRPAARMIAASSRAWRKWDDLAGLRELPADEAWAADRELVDGSLRDPWESR